jgi:ZIP family zinc transporter
VLRLLLAATLTGCATAAGALPFLFVPAVGRRAYDSMLGLGAGLMLAAATLGLLPPALKGVSASGTIDATHLVLVLVGFAAGVALLSLMDRLIPHQHAGGHHQHVGASGHGHGHEHEHEHGHGHGLGLGAHAYAEPELHAHEDERARHQGLLVLGAMALHRLPEGFAIGAGFASDRTRPLGVMLSIAIAVQNAVEGAVMAAPLRRGGMPKGRLLGLVALTGLAVPAAAVVGYYLSAAEGALPTALALAAGALLYLACNEVIPESHSHGNERSATFGLLAGFVFIICLEALTG